MYDDDEYEELVEGDEDDDEEEALVEGDEYGAKRRKRRRGRKSPGTQLILFPLTACPVGTAVNIQAQVNRDCRAIDLRVIGTIVATGVVSAGAELVDLRVHGKTLFNSNGPVPAELLSPLSPTSPRGNANFKEMIRSGESITLTMQTLAGGAATAVAGSLLCKAYN